MRCLKTIYVLWFSWSIRLSLFPLHKHIYILILILLFYPSFLLSFLQTILDMRKSNSPYNKKESEIERWTVAVATRDGRCSYRVGAMAPVPVATTPSAVPGGFAVMMPVSVSLSVPDFGSFPVPVLTDGTAVLLMVSLFFDL